MTDAEVGDDDSQANVEVTTESAERNSLAERRDTAARARDTAARARDRVASRRKQAATDRDESAAPVGPSSQSEPQDANADRNASAADRNASAADRNASAADRNASAADRDASASEIELLLRDGLSGTYLRNAGLTELRREIARSRRTGVPFTLAFIDVDHLKAVNDELGHAAGDRLILQVVAAIKGVVREYDVVVRYGGDEFLCGALGMDLADAQSRFEQVNVRMTATGGGTASVGVAQLGEDEDLDQLIARADAAMFARKRHNP